MTIKQAMVLAEGYGRRLAPLTDYTPKPLLPINGTTLLDLALDRAREHGIERCVVNTHHLADQIQEHLKDRQDPKITLSYEPFVLETAGGIIQALPHFGGKPFFGLNADIWWENGEKPALELLESSWNEARMDALLLLIPLENAWAYPGTGDFFMDDEGKLTFRGEAPSAPFIYGGVQILHPRLFEGRPVEPLALPTLYREAAAAGRLYGVIHTGVWADLGTHYALITVKSRLEGGAPCADSLPSR